MPTEPIPQTQVRAFLIADVRGYTRFTNERGDEAAARLADRFASIAKDVVEHAGGDLIELRGDEALAVFDSPRFCLRAALSLQEHFREASETQPDSPLPVGVGIDAGEAVPIQGGYRTGALNVAARLCSIAGPGEVFASETVIGLARAMDGVEYLDRGEVELKGLAELVRVIQVAREDSVPAGAAKFAVQRDPPNNLPAQTTPFIGREHDLVKITGLLLRADIRLLTLTGPGGTGKTRLSLQVAGEVLSHFPDGVYFVPLASVADPELIPSVIAAVLAVREAGSQPLEQTLANYLRGKRMLLVLDNFEHLLPGAVFLSPLLAAARDLTLLVTSRAVLRISGEHEYQVEPLSLPDPKGITGFEALAGFEAVALFVDRARAVKPDFALTEQNAADIAEICLRLDGLPLAIELAAARTRLLPPPALLARLTNRLQLLIGGARDAPGRQQTLRGTIDWSYSLLTAPEQEFFARLGVFQGGCTLEGAEAVCDPDGDTGLDALDGIGSLIEKSLVRQDSSRSDAAEPRFLMLETIREYALERLAASDTSHQIHERHAQYFLTLAKAAAAEMQGPDQAEWFNRLDADHDNLRAALAWFLEHGDLERELLLAAALQPFWHARDHFSEGRRWLEAGLERSADVPPPVRQRALHAAGTFAMIQGDQARTIALMEELLPLSRETGDMLMTKNALVLLGMTAIQRGDHVEATRHLGESLDVARELGDPFVLAQSVYGLGLARSEAGAYAEALSLIDEALALFKDRGGAFWTMNAIGSLGYLALLQDKHREARELLLDYLRRAYDLMDKIDIAAALEGLAALAAEEDGLMQAARLFVAARFLRGEIGGRLMSLRNRTMIERIEMATRERVGEAEWQAALTECRRLSLEQIVGQALAI